MTPDVFSFSAAISACVKGWLWEHAVTLFDNEIGITANVISISSETLKCKKDETEGAGNGAD